MKAHHFFKLYWGKVLLLNLLLAVSFWALHENTLRSQPEMSSVRLAGIIRDDAQLPQLLDRLRKIPGVLNARTEAVGEDLESLANELSIDSETLGLVTRELGDSQYLVVSVDEQVGRKNHQLLKRYIEKSMGDRILQLSLSYRSDVAKKQIIRLFGAPLRYDFPGFIFLILAGACYILALMVAFSIISTAKNLFGIVQAFQRGRFLFEKSLVQIFLLVVAVGVVSSQLVSVSTIEVVTLMTTVLLLWGGISYFWVQGPSRS